jgi:hypothetical protein
MIKVNLTMPAGGMPGRGGPLVVPDQAVVARPVTSFQIVKRWCISMRGTVKLTLIMIYFAKATTI